MNVTRSVKPYPGDPETAARWRHLEKIRRAMEGRWEEDIKARLLERLGRERKQAWGRPDMASCTLKRVCRQTAILYDQEPVIGHEDPAAAARLQVELRLSRWPSLMQTWQPLILAQRELAVRVHVPTDPASPLVLRQVYADMLDGEADDMAPDQPALLRELRLRKPAASTGQAEPVWTWDEVDLRGEKPVYRVIDDRTKGDVTDAYASGVSPYPWVDSKGRAVSPYVLYHACPGQQLWDSYQTIELYEGSLEVAVGLSNYQHVIRNASWPQRWALNVSTARDAVDTDGDGRSVSHVVADPAAVLMLYTAAEDDSRQPQIGQWETSADPATMLESVLSYERYVAGANDIGPADFQRAEGDPRSAYAMALSHEGRIRAATKYRQAFAEADARLCRLVAICLNRFRGESLPEEGYTVTYPAIPSSPLEMMGRGADGAKRETSDIINDNTSEVGNGNE